jgi:hypothetical protein
MSNIFRLSSKSWQLLTIIFSVVIVINLLSPFGMTIALASIAPTPIYPINNTHTTPDTDPPLGIPSFAWSAVPGANVYRLQVDSDIFFSQPIFLDITTRNLSYTPQSTNQLLFDGEWYWRVRVEDPAPVSDWNLVMRFTKTWATATNKPVLVSPVDSQLLPFFDYPVFSWMPVVGAASFSFQIANTPSGFDSPLYNIVTLSTSHQPPIRLANGIYYWRVIPQDSANHLGMPSEVRYFTASYGTYLTNMVPTLVSPIDESFPTFTPTFHWMAIEGAEQYRLEYTSSPTCDFSVGANVETRQTSYSPTDTLLNDFRYCWRVRVESGPAVGDWSQTWHFQKRWNLKPILLTPTNLYQTGLYPIFSWTPIPGVAKYEIQIAQNPNFSPIFESSVTANTTYAYQNNYVGNSPYWWRVRPIDGGGGYGVFSDISEYQNVYTSTAPILISPLYYYSPNDYPGYSMNPDEDRTVAFPIFQWHRILNPAPVGGTYAIAYRIQVNDTPYFNSPLWQYDTENTSATPVADDDFAPIVGQDYFWRVCPLDGMAGECLTNPETGLIWWSQTWTARFDSSLKLQPTTGIAPELLRPAPAQKMVESTPMLEWWPLEGAAQYQVEVSRESSFSSHEITETVNIPAYSPNKSLAQRNLGRTDYGTFFWHVRGLTGGVWSEWSDTWRFQIASQSVWRYTRTLGGVDNKLIIGDDPAGMQNRSMTCQLYMLLKLIIIGS